MSIFNFFPKSKKSTYFTIDRFPNTIPLGGRFFLKLLDPSKLDLESSMYWANSNSEEVKRFLPGAYVSNAKQAKEILKERMDAIAFGFEIGYRICLNSGTIGYIIIGTGKMNTNRTQGAFSGFTIDFWVGEIVRGQNIATAALSNAIKFLFDSGLDEVYALTDPDNTASHRVLEKCDFSRIPNTDWHYKYAYGNACLYKVNNPRRTS